MSTPTNPPASRAREDETISFVRWRLFAVFTVMAWTSLFKPRLGLEMVDDAGNGAAAKCRKDHSARGLFETYNTWPKDVREKLSCHDLRRMSGWAPQTNVGEWRIDTSAGGPILVYKGCSVIEGEDAQYVLSLIHRDAELSGG